MNKIVREHYPVANLPEDLREGLETDATVRVVIEETDASAADDDHQHKYPGFRDIEMHARKPLTIEETLEMIRAYKSLGRPSVSPEEAVARIRALRDEWDD